MASNSPAIVEVPEREPEKAEQPSSSPFLAPQPEVERPPFVIKLMSTVPM